MTRGDVVVADLIGEKGRGVKFDVRIARHAGVRRPAFLVGAHKVPHDTLVEKLFEVERKVRQAHPVRRVAGKENRIRRAARAAAFFAVVQPERYCGDVVTGLLEKQGRHRRVEDERERVFLADGERATQGSLDVHLGDAGRLDEVLARDQLRQRRARGDARRASVDLVTDLLQHVLGDTDRKARDVAAGLVARLSASGGIRNLTGVSRPYEMVNNLWGVAIWHQYPAFS